MRAVVLTDGPGDVDRLVAQLSRLGIDDTLVLESRGVAADLRAVGAMASESGDGLVVAGGDIFTHGEVLAGLLGDPRIQTGVLVTDEEVEGEWRVRSTRGRVESAGSPWHTVSGSSTGTFGTFLGVLKVAPSEVTLLAEIASPLADLVDAEPREASAPRDVPALLAVGLARSGVHVKQSYRRELYWARLGSAADLERAREEIEGYDEDKVLLDSAVKSVDSFFTTFLVSPYSKYIARWAARRGLTPNFVTSVSMAVGVAAAACFAVGDRWGLVAGAVLLQIAFTLDCVDGQLARYTRTFSKFGAWLDSVFDRGKEYVVFAGLALGASRTGDAVWILAGAALTLQTVRHSLDFSWAASRHADLGSAWQPPLSARSDRRPATPSAPLPSTPLPSAPLPSAPLPSAPLPSASPPSAPPTQARQPASARILGGWLRLNRWPGMIWVKRALAFPIGERFFAISLTAALFSAQTTFVVVIVGGAIAGLYGLAGRVLRSTR